MQLAFYAALGIGSLIALSGPAGRSVRTTATLPQPDSVALASKLVGKWTGKRFESSSTTGQRYTMQWKKDTTGALVGTVSMPSGSSYATRVVWSSDTGFITESAPHKSGKLGEEVVTRTLSHFKGDSLTGTFEMRPMTYKGHSETGHFSAKKG
ncbi:MAG: hypothetical protein ACTHM9_11420 [Gemmatimonadales bacterium]